jgi:putative ABC transport system permease protein
MGKTLLVYRLAVRDMRRHAAQALLLVVAIAAATATLTMALAMNGVTSHPYAATRAATRGPDVVAYLSSASQARTLVHASGVTSSGGPYPVAYGMISFEGRTAAVFAEGRSQAPAAVDQPDMTAGSWVRPGGVVLERTFAEALGAAAGDVVTINGQRFKVAGIAVSAAQPAYPNLCYGPTIPGPEGSGSACPAWFGIHTAKVNTDDSGQIWLTEADAIGLTSKADPLTMYVLNLKLASGADAQSFVDQHYRAPVSDWQNFAGPVFTTSQAIAATDALLVQDGQSVLEPGTLLLALLAIASVTVLVGRRLSEYAPRVGLLKAVGSTPALVAAMFLAENLVLALVAAAAGLAAGWLAAPLLTNPGAALVGAPGAPSLTAVTAAEVVAVALAVALAATLVPAVRAARTSTIGAISDVAHPPGRRGALIRISTRLPLPALFGLRLAARRPRRALLSAANVAVTVTGIVAVLCFHADVDSKLGATTSSLTAGGLHDPVVTRDEQMLAVITVMLIVVAALNAIFTTWATVTDARRASALMRALGTRTRQLSTGLVITQVLCALPGAIVGIPLGYLLFKAAVHDGTPAPAGWLAATALGTLLVMAGLTLVPARIGARQPVAEVLQSEAA